MAGSKRPFVYTDDGGTEYVVNLDESTYENALLGFGTSATQQGRLFPIIRGNPVKMRYVNTYRDEEGVTVRRRFFIGKHDVAVYIEGGQLNFGQANDGNQVEDGDVWQVSSSIGEKRRFIGLVDSGQLDGDEDAPIVQPVEDPPAGE